MKELLQLKQRVFPRNESLAFMSDELLMQQFQNSCCEESFQEIVSRYQQQALAVARTYFFEDREVEDIVQDAFVKVIRKKLDYSTESRFAPWFFTIVRRLCIDLYRSKKIRKALSWRVQEENPHVEPSPGISLGVLNKLPLHEREVLKLRIINDFSFQQISDALGLPIETAKKRSQRGLARLRKELDSSPDF